MIQLSDTATGELNQDIVITEFFHYPARLDDDGDLDFIKLKNEPDPNPNEANLDF